jgi:threonine 3-dehydrogenase
MTILITGGTGFIGAEIVRMLLDREAGPIHVAHRSGNFDRLADVVDDLVLHQVDLADQDGITAMVQDVQPTKLFHFGAMLTGHGEADNRGLLESNAIGVITLFEEARAAGVEQIIFASSIGTYGRDLPPGEPVTDLSLQRPSTIYGVTKVFAENLGAYYRTKYGLDFRGLRYPSIVGPGVTTKSLAQYTSWMIEESARGNPFTVWTVPETVIPILYYRDAAQAALDLAAAPFDAIQSINYLVDGARPTPTAGELADAVRRQIPNAAITFDPDPAAALTLARNLNIDDTAARTEWGWQPAHDVDAMISDMIAAVSST